MGARLFGRLLFASTSRPVEPPVTSVVTEHAAEPTPSAGGDGRALFRRPPRRLFHGILIATGVVVLWAFSFPGVHSLAIVPCILIVGIAAVTWVIRGITYLVARQRGAHTGRAIWFVVAPLGALALGVILWANVPLRFRWEFSKGAFNDAVSDVRADPSSWTGRNPRRVGTYEILTVHVVPQGIVFYESVGAAFDDAGFAYLPHGPSDEMANGSFENPQWLALGDHWYAWTASW